MHDLRITGGTVVDGTGAPGRRADVMVREGRITEVGTSVGPARRTVDATGLVVAPGFIDSHTHLDAQLSWDPAATPSCLHGVTTVLGGNCGFGVAPLDGVDAGYLRRMLARVEGMPLESLESGMTWNWSSFGDWLDRLEGRVGVNAGFSVGHSTLRRLAMGPTATGSTATEGQMAEMAAILRRSLSEGALGLTTSLATSHRDGDGRPVPSRWAAAAEIETLAAAVGGHAGTSLGINPGARPFPGDVLDLFAALSRAADRVLNWNALLVDGDRGDAVRQELAASDHVADRGGCLVAEVAPDPRRFYVSLAGPFLFDGVPGWDELFTLGADDRLRALGDPGVRRRLAEGLASGELPAVLRNHVTPTRMTVVDAGPADAASNGRRVSELAAAAGTTPLDVVLDLAVSSSLEAVFLPDPAGDDDASWALRGQALADPRTLIGAADAGAHLDVASSFGYATSVLGGAVRSRGLLTLAEAVHELSDRPARLFGLRDRGRVSEGFWADLVVFHAETVGPEPPTIRHDLPGGARRIYAGATGVELVCVNGVPICDGGELTGELPGAVLRSGRDTETVSAAVGRALTTGRAA